MNNTITQRDSFFKKLYEIGKKDRNVVVISADMGAPSLDVIRKDLSAQFVNTGIAEQNTITVAAGLAMTGKKVFVYAIAPFMTIRCLEQIRVECAMMNIPITIIGIGASFSYEDSGPTHHTLEDIAMLRSMPNIQINSITDTVMASAFAEISYQSKVANYIRLDRLVTPNIYDSKHDFNDGLAVLRKGKDFYILSTGAITHNALAIANKLNVGLIDVYNIPINEKLLLEKIKGAKKLVTLEENFLPGGFGSAVCEVLNDNNIRVPVKRLGLEINKGYCYKYGGRNLIRKNYGIDNESVEKVIKELK